MAIGKSLHIGVNRVDPEHYSGWSGPLNACEADANVMQSIAAGQGYETQALITAAATREAVMMAISACAKSLNSGDIFLLSYAGHGGQITDFDGDEEDKKDETWCLYDGQLLDDELNILWSEFKQGVRVLVFSDSCHSGSVSKGSTARSEAPISGHARNMPRANASETLRKNRAFYANLQYQLPHPRPAIKATVRLLSGCQDDQLSVETEANGRFTIAVRDSFSDEQVSAGYDSFYQAILSRMPDYQTPNHYTIGMENTEFKQERAFSI